MSGDEFTKFVKMQLALTFIKKDVDMLWKCIQDGMYDARSRVGDATLRMHEELESVKDILEERVDET